MRSAVSVLLNRGSGLFLLSLLLPRVEFAKSISPGIKGLKEATPFRFWAASPKVETWALSF